MADETIKQNVQVKPSLKTKKVFIYQWQLEGLEEAETDYNYPLCVNIYGLDSDNKSTRLIIKDFTPYVYLELPNNVNWTESKKASLSNFIQSRMQKCKPEKVVFMRKKKLYYASKTKVNGEYEDKLYPFLFVSFKNG